MDAEGIKMFSPSLRLFFFTPRPILHPEITSCFYPNFISELPGMVPNNPANRGNNIIISHTIQGNPSGEPTDRMSSFLIETTDVHESERLCASACT